MSSHVLMMAHCDGTFLDVSRDDCSCQRKDLDGGDSAFLLVKLSIQQVPPFPLAQILLFLLFLPYHRCSRPL